MSEGEGLDHGGEEEDEDVGGALRPGRIRILQEVDDVLEQDRTDEEADVVDELEEGRHEEGPPECGGHRGGQRAAFGEVRRWGTVFGPPHARILPRMARSRVCEGVVHASCAVLAWKWVEVVRFEWLGRRSGETRDGAHFGPDCRTRWFPSTSSGLTQAKSRRDIQEAASSGVIVPLAGAGVDGDAILGSCYAQGTRHREFRRAAQLWPPPEGVSPHGYAE